VDKRERSDSNPHHHKLFVVWAFERKNKPSDSLAVSLAIASPSPVSAVFAFGRSLFNRFSLFLGVPGFEK